MHDDHYETEDGPEANPYLDLDPAEREALIEENRRQMDAFREAIRAAGGRI